MLRDLIHRQPFVDELQARLAILLVVEQKSHTRGLVELDVASLEGIRFHKFPAATIWSASIFIWICHPIALTRFDSGSTISIVVMAAVVRLAAREKRMPRIPPASNIFNWASVTLG